MFGILNISIMLYLFDEKEMHNILHCTGILNMLVCVSDGERGPILPGQRGAYQRALSVDSKPKGGETAMGGGLATRRNVPCPMLVKQENMDAPIRPGTVPNGFPGGMGVCPPRGNPTSNLNT